MHFSPAAASLMAGGAMRKLTPHAPGFSTGIRLYCAPAPGCTTTFFCSAFYLAEGDVGSEIQPRNP